MSLGHSGKKGQIGKVIEFKYLIWIILAVLIGSVLFYSLIKISHIFWPK